VAGFATFLAPKRLSRLAAGAAFFPLFIAFHICSSPCTTIHHSVGPHDQVKSHACWWPWAEADYNWERSARGET
jgi:hypothetical protein